MATKKQVEVTDMDAFSVTVDVTQQCNFRCGYCYCGHEHPKRVVDMDKYHKSLDVVWPKVREAGGFSLGFMGGEPLCAFDTVMTLVNRAWRRCGKEGLPFHWGMTSNMSLFQDMHAIFCGKTRGSVNVSLDGRKYSHDLNRPFANGKSSFDDVMHGIEVLRRYEMLSGARLTITPATIGFLADNIVFLAEEGFTSIAAFPAFSVSWSEPRFEIVRAQASIIAKLRRTVLRNVTSLHPFDAYAYVATHGHPKKEVRHHCGACRSSLAMDVDGHLYPCHRFTSGDEFRVTDVGVSWASIKDQFERALSPHCLSCKVFGACRGGCWAENKATTGSLAMPLSEHCRYNLAFFDGIVDAGYICPGSKPPDIIIAGEGSCLTTDICVVCNCRTGGCTSCDRCDECHHCDSSDRCNRCDHCDDCHRCDRCQGYDR